MPGTHSGDPGLDHISQAERFCTNIKSPSEESSSLKKKKPPHDSYNRGHVPWDTDLEPKIKKQKCT